MKPLSLASWSVPFLGALSLSLFPLLSLPTHAAAQSPATTVPAAQNAFAASSPFQDHMVLQQNKPVAVWGSARPGDTIRVQFAGKNKETKADAQGAWRVFLDPLAASAEGREMTLTRNATDTLTIKDVLVGEVWLASGQSNMGVGLLGALNGREEASKAQLPQVRFFSVPTRGSLHPLDSTPGTWQAIAPKTAATMSAVAYFFARDLHQKLQCPIGILISAVGGTTGESWTPAEVLQKDPEWSKELTDQQNEVRRNEDLSRTFPEKLQAWRAANQCETASESTDWASPDRDTADWQKVSGRFPFGKTLGLKSGGVFWLRKEFESREVDANKPAYLWIDSIDRQILTLFINGKEVATLGNTAPRFFQTGLIPVTVPRGIVQPGRNVLAIRCTTFSSDTLKWFSGPNLRLPVAEPKKVSDEWLLKAETVFPVLSSEALAALPVFTNMDILHAPAGLYNAMIHPLQPYTIQGAIWYQGESNIKRADRYQSLLTGLIGGWRSIWRQGDFPFYVVQLANYHGAPDQPAATDRPNVHDQLGRLREAQMLASRTVPHSGLAVAIDIGEESIHPANKQDVADRLARLALAKTYGRKEVAHQSPVYDSIRREGSTLRVLFTDCPEGLMAASKNGIEPARETPGAKLQHFAISGADHRFVWAEARIDGASVIVSSPAVPEPVAVRYAWCENPKGCNLYGKNGLPAAPFRSDSLPAPAAPQPIAR